MYTLLDWQFFRLYSTTLTGMLNRFIITLFFFSCCLSVRAQTREADSLHAIARKVPQDTTVINALLALAQSTGSDNYDSSMLYAHQALAIAEKLNDRIWQGRSNYQMGATSFAFGYAKESIGYFETAIRFLSDGDSIKYWIAKSMNGMGNAQRRLGRLKEATDSYLGAKEIYEAIGDKKGIAGTYNNLGIIFNEEGQPEKALEYYAIARKMNIEINNQSWLSKNYSNMGTAYYNMKQYDSAEVYFKLGMQMSLDLGDQHGWAQDMMNLGNVYTSKKNFGAAESQFITTLNFYRQNGYEPDMALAMHNLAGLYTATGQYDKSKLYLDSAAAISLRYEDLSSLVEIYQGYASMYSGAGDYKSAFTYYGLFATLRDSIQSTDMKNQMDQMEESLREEKLNEKNLELEQTKELQDIQLNRSNIIIASAGGGIVLVLLLAFVVFKRYQLKKKANDLLKERNLEIQKQKAIIEQKSLDISDSINYAKKIQDTVIPDTAPFLSAYADSFVLYRPRNIVSGDFYWYALSDKKNHIAVADCTGHGVPGAFMSMIGIDKMHHAVVESGISQPSKALGAVNRGLKLALRQSDDIEGMRDGMDIALIAIDHKTNTLEYAGANRPLWIIRNNELIEMNPSKVSLGGFTATAHEFSQMEFQLEKNDCIYLFTDGYADQFGGPKGKKMMTKKFREILISVCDKPLAEQKIHLEQQFDLWKGALEQVDDVCVIGIRY
jgi:serine phosphatase RsbU (regulator of sigma subunit)/Tfp pilus assembly protein PilF